VAAGPQEIIPGHAGTVEDLHEDAGGNWLEGSSVTALVGAVKALFEERSVDFPERPGVWARQLDVLVNTGPEKKPDMSYSMSRTTPSPSYDLSRDGVSEAFEACEESSDTPP
jgi:hypothetical protein